MFRAIFDNQSWTYKESLNRLIIERRRSVASGRKFSNGLLIVLIVLILLLSIALFLEEMITSSQSMSVIEVPDISMILGSICLILLTFYFYRLLEVKYRKVILPKALNEDSVSVDSNIDGKERSIASLFSAEVRSAVDEAFLLADRLGHSQVMPEHLFASILHEEGSRPLLLRLGLNKSSLMEPISRQLSKFPQGDMVESEYLNKIIVQAFVASLHDHRSELSLIEVIHQAYLSSDYLQELLYSLDVDEDEFNSVIEWLRLQEQLIERYKSNRQLAAFKPTSNMNRAYTAQATPFLDTLSEDLTRSAVSGYLPMMIGRKREMDEMLRSIEGSGRSILLIGETGVGKKSLIYGLADRMVEEAVPQRLQDKRLLELSVPQLISKGDMPPEDKLLRAMREGGASGNVVFVIDGLDQMVEAQPTLASVLVSELERGYTFVIATASTAGYRALEQGPIKAIFSPIRVEEMDKAEALRVLQSRVGSIEHKHKVFFNYEALDACVELSMRYMHDSFLPDKALTVAEEVSLKYSTGEWKMIDKKMVADLISEKTNVPVYDATKEERETLVNLEELIHKRVIGQDMAVKAVSSALRRARTKLRSENRPIANFLFLGPTGVGKTELAKSTAEAFFSSEETMMRFDMSEYQDISAIDRLIGGNGEGGLLTEAVRRQPYGIVLLDELEKAHPDILNLFLQVMDDGRLTDGAGRTVDFTNTILIATSNAGSDYIQNSVKGGVGVEVMKEHLVNEELRGIYRPEFLNRFDDIIVFTPLTQNDVVAIAYLMVDKVKDRLEAKGIEFNISDDVVHELAKEGYDPAFGARPLRRVIQSRVDDAIADLLLKEEVGRRDKIVMDSAGVHLQKAEAL